MMLKKLERAVTILFVLFLSLNFVVAEKNEIETEIIGLPNEIEAGEEYDFTVVVTNLAEYNATDIKGFIDINSFEAKIENRIIDIEFLEAGESKQVKASLISNITLFNPVIKVIIESYKLNKSRRYRGEEDFKLKEDTQEIKVVEKNKLKGFYIAGLVLTVFIVSFFFVLRKVKKK